jgi:protein-disulfide isomerase
VAAKRLLMIVLLLVVLGSTLAGFFTLLQPRGGGVGGGEDLARCPENSIVIVVPKGYSAEERARLASIVRLALASYAPGYDFCEVSEANVPWKLRAYPALLVKGEPPSRLKELVAGYVNGYALLDYTLASTLALNLGLPVKFTATAEAFIVKGESEWGSLGRKTDTVKLVDALEALVVARITDVKVIEKDEIPFRFKSYPAVLLRSDYDLASANRYVTRLDSNYYTFKEDVQPQVSLLVSGSSAELHWEVEPPPNTPWWGSANATLRILIFEDLACPYCARFYANVYPSVVKPLLEKGVAAIYALDFIVHREVEKHHRLLWCMYKLTGNGTLYAELVKESYRVLSDSRSPISYDSLVNKIREKLGRDADRIIDCVDSESAKQHLDTVRQLASKLGVRGTPTIAVVGGGYTILVYGLPEPSTLEKIVNWLMERAS